ncbi:MAG: Na+/H+ antiporter subunit E [Bacteroidetes bacterium]|nr:Na+/H+ antiporter subunit E [Bacteroidota bacterium]
MEKEKKNIFQEKRRRTWQGILVQSAFLLALWLLLSGYFDFFHISLGVLSVTIVQLLNSKINRLQFYKRDIPEWERVYYGRAFMYLFWLIWQIVVASLQVAYIVMHPRMPINPSILRFKAKMPNTGASVILGNSITLTPGTVTVLLEGDDFTVHSLLDESSAGLIDGTMPRKVTKLFRRSAGEVVSDIQILRSKKELH